MVWPMSFPAVFTCSDCKKKVEASDAEWELESGRLVGARHKEHNG